jgi:hypothetical protein
MSLLQEPQCPRCGSTLPMRALWDFARLEESKVLPGLGFLNRWGLLRGKIGVACPNCRAKFKIVQTRIVLVRLAAWLLLLICAGWFGIWRRRANLVLDQWLEFFVALAVVLGFMLLQRILTPYLAQVRPVGDDEQLSYPLKSAYEGPTASGSDH